MSFSFYVPCQSPPLWSAVLREAILPLEFPEGEVDRRGRPKLSKLYAHGYVAFRTLRGVEIHHEAGSLEVRLFTGSGAADLDLALAITSAAARIARSSVDLEDGMTLSRRDFLRAHPPAWRLAQREGDVEILAGMVAAQDDPLTLSHPLGTVAFGRATLAAVLEAHEGGLSLGEAYESVVREAVWAPRARGYGTARVRVFESGSFGEVDPARGTHVPPVTAYALFLPTGDALGLTREDVEALWGEGLRALDDANLLLDPIEEGERPAFWKEAKRLSKGMIPSERFLP